MYISIGNHHFYNNVITFYQKLKENNDYDNQYRLAIKLIEGEINMGMLIKAKEHFEEISTPFFLKKLRMAKSTINFGIKNLEVKLKEETEKV